MGIDERIKTLLSEKNLTASAMAELMDVQASTLSHILSGRNNPSLDILIKIKKTFPDVDLDWLLMGEKSKIQKPIEVSLFSNLDEDFKEPQIQKSIEKIPHEHYSSEIEKVILLLGKGKFREYNK